MPADTVVDVLLAELGADVVDLVADERFHGDWSGVGRTAPAAVVRPRTTAEVSATLRICSAHRQPVVPQGGLTGLAGGATPRPGDIALSIERMHGIEEVDEAAGTMTVLAGTTLADAQAAAAAAGWELGWDLGARGSCQIGGNLATNAGGNRVLRYGMARDNVLGLEVVLADGTVLSSLHGMLKNNTGYDLRHLFCGSEGTLGVITRAVLRLHPQPRTRTTALASLADYPTVVRFLRHAQRTVGGVTAYEAMWSYFYEHVTAGLSGRRPLPVGAPFYALVEISGDDPDHDATRFTAMLAAAADDGLITDAVVAESAADTGAFWRIREGEPIDRLPSVVNFDVSLPIGSIGDFATACEERLRAHWPDGHYFHYGHIGDGNLHLSLSVGPIDHEAAVEIDDIVYGAVHEWRGSISAEHGIGTLKRDYLGVTRSAAEVDVMQRIKRALDPLGILNPGKVLAIPQR